MIKIDGTVYDVKCTIGRVSELKASDISGLMMDKNYFNDVVGTYLKYEIALDFPLRNRDKYSEIYELLNDPVDGHTFELPYNASTVTLNGRVESVSDQHEVMPGGYKYWKALKFSIIANNPIKAHTLGETITRGRAPVPDIAQPNEGDTFIWNEGRWAKTAEYPDADDIAY